MLRDEKEINGTIFSLFYIVNLTIGATSHRHTHTHAHTLYYTRASYNQSNEIIIYQELYVLQIVYEINMHGLLTSHTRKFTGYVGIS